MFYIQYLAIYISAISLHSRRSDLNISRSVVAAFEYPDHRRRPPELLSFGTENESSW